MLSVWYIDVDIANLRYRLSESEDIQRSKRMPALQLGECGHFATSYPKNRAYRDTRRELTLGKFRGGSLLSIAANSLCDQDFASLEDVELRQAGFLRKLTTA